MHSLRRMAFMATFKVDNHLHDLRTVRAFCVGMAIYIRPADTWPGPTLMNQILPGLINYRVGYRFFHFLKIQSGSQPEPNPFIYKLKILKYPHIYIYIYTHLERSENKDTKRDWLCVKCFSLFIHDFLVGLFIFQLFNFILWFSLPILKSLLFFKNFCMWVFHSLISLIFST